MAIAVGNDPYVTTPHPKHSVIRGKTVVHDGFLVNSIVESINLPINEENQVLEYSMYKVDEWKSFSEGLRSISIDNRR